MAKDKPKDETATIRQRAAVVTTITGPVKIRGIHAYDAAGTRVARVGIDLTENDDE